MFLIKRIVDPQLCYVNRLNKKKYWDKKIRDEHRFIISVIPGRRFHESWALLKHFVALK